MIHKNDLYSKIRSSVGLVLRSSSQCVHTRMANSSMWPLGTYYYDWEFDSWFGQLRHTVTLYHYSDWDSWTTPSRSVQRSTLSRAFLSFRIGLGLTQGRCRCLSSPYVMCSWDFHPLPGPRLPDLQSVFGRLTDTVTRLHICSLL
jgi:hypothetical protein